MKVLESGQYRKWKAHLRDARIVHRINARIRSIVNAERIVGDYKSLGGGVFELRFDMGPGYRVYVALEDGGELLLLLAGGDKSRQQKDIASARKILNDWRG